MVNVTTRVKTILKLREDDKESALVIWDRGLPGLSALGNPISVVLAIGRYIPSFLGNAMDWMSGSIESAKQAMLEREENIEVRHGKAACERVPRYPFEIY